MKGVSWLVTWCRLPFISWCVWRWVDLLAWQMTDYGLFVFDVMEHVMCDSLAPWSEPLTSSRLIRRATSWSLSLICPFSLSPSLTESDSLEVDTVGTINRKLMEMLLHLSQTDEPSDWPDIELTSLCVCSGLKIHHVRHSLSELLLQLNPEGLLPLQGQSGPSLSAVQCRRQARTRHLDGVGRPRQLVPHVRQVPAIGGRWSEGQMLGHCQVLLCSPSFVGFKS